MIPPSESSGSEQPKLKHKVAIITGGGRGIGEAVALAFAAEGAKLVLVARTGSELEHVAAQVAACNGESLVVPADVANRDEVVRIVQSAIDAYGQVDILVNVAGIYGPIGPAWEVDPLVWERAVQVNLFGTFFACQAVLAHMVPRRQGKIINFSGGGATSPLPRFSAYGVSKTAVVRLTETLAEELTDFNIQVNAIAPGAVDTRLQDEVLEAGERAGNLLSRIRQMRETGEGGVPRERAAQLAVFLASSRSDGLTGKLIAAPYDGWESWDAGRIGELMALPWFTLRRLDEVTLRPFRDRVS
jgi:NAD(P)-dependent dehydrogenase (short-subunit alcohol dehydrogenase family)